MNWSIRVGRPKVRGEGTGAYVTFPVYLCVVGGEGEENMVVVATGYRLRWGRLLPPQTLGRKGGYFTVVFCNKSLAGRLYDAVVGVIQDGTWSLPEGMPPLLGEVEATEDLLYEANAVRAMFE